MNERIKELAEQATTEESDGFKYFDKEKFAELIVRECIKVIKDSEGYSQYFPHVTDNVGKNFGVEE